WDVFPFILNRNRSSIKMNSGHEKIEDGDALQNLANQVENYGVYNKTQTRQDELTFIAAKEHIQKFKPSIVYISFGKTDEMAHQGRYDLYLEGITAIDKMIEELWHWAQSTRGYKDNTTFILTTDHGRGKSPSTWMNHG